MKKLVIRVAAVAVMLVCMNWVYSKWLFRNDLVKYSDIVELSWQVADDSCRIVYVGESSNNHYGKEEPDRRKISAYASEYFPTVKMGDMTREASHAQTYYYMLKHIPEDAAVETVVVTMNLRSFGSSWIYSRLETALRKQLVLLKDYPPFFNRFLLAFKAYTIHSDEEWDNMAKEARRTAPLDFPYEFQHPTSDEWDKSMAWNGWRDEEGNRDQTKTELACHYVKTYAFTITDDNPRVADFDAIVELCRQRGWHLIFNLMAENVDKANELVGEDLLFLMRRNRDYLLQRYGSMEDVVIVDNLSLVRDVNFIDQNWTTEHYYEEGRRVIADNVAKALKTFYPNEYANPNTLHYDYGHFCGNPAWHPIEASRPCGAGFVVDSLSSDWDEVDVAFFAKPSDSIASIFLAAQCVDAEGQKTVKTYPLPMKHYGVRSWDFHTQSIVLDSVFKASNNVKLYLVSTSEVPVEVSALDVSFHPANLEPEIKGKRQSP